jgi:hypothetical protein
MVEAKYLLKIKNASQKILANFFVSEVFIKIVIFSMLLMNLSVTHVFIKQIFRTVELAPPPSPSPSQGCAGDGVVVAFFSHKQL